MPLPREPANYLLEMLAEQYPELRPDSALPLQGMHLTLSDEGWQTTEILAAIDAGVNAGWYEIREDVPFLTDAGYAAMRD